MDDREFIEGLRRKDAAAVRHLSECLLPSLWRFVYFRVKGDQHLAEDIVSETVLSLIQVVAASDGNAASDRNVVCPGAWMRGVAAHKIQDHFRAVARVQHLIDQADSIAESRQPAQPAAEAEERKAAIRKVMDDLVLPTITIPEIDVANGMARIEPADDFVVGGGVGDGDRRRSMSAFDIDPTELTVGQYKKTPTSKVTNDARYTSVPDDYALCMPFDDCVRIAESKGKRLPTAAEFEFAATARGRQPFPWGTNAMDDAQWNAAMAIGPVGAFVLDSLNT